MNQKTAPSKNVVRNKAVCGGVPIVEGTRIRVSDVVIEYEHHHLSPEEIAREFPSVSIADVFTALSYYYQNPKNIRDEIRKRHQLFMRQKALHNGHHTMRRAHKEGDN